MNRIIITYPYKTKINVDVYKQRWNAVLWGHSLCDSSVAGFQEDWRRVRCNRSINKFPWGVVIVVFFFFVRLFFVGFLHSLHSNPYPWYTLPKEEIIFEKKTCWRLIRKHLALPLSAGNGDSLREEGYTVTHVLASSMNTGVVFFFLFFTRR